MEKLGHLRDFEQVVLPHLDAAHNLARWLVRDPPTAEDVVQDAVMRAWKYFASFRGGSVRAWLLQIVRNTAYSCIRTRRRAAEVLLSSGERAGRDEDADEEGVDLQLLDPRPGPEATLIYRQNLAVLDQALSALPTALRECLILRELEMFSYKEIARITSVPIGTVMSRLACAREALRNEASADEHHRLARKGHEREQHATRLQVDVNPPGERRRVS
jgi:RNA polymerase sigma-70 factor (ECF subfamily)